MSGSGVKGGSKIGGKRLAISAPPNQKRTNAFATYVIRLNHKNPTDRSTILERRNQYI